MIDAADLEIAGVAAAPRAAAADAVAAVAAADAAGTTDAIGRLDDEVAAFEKALLQRLYPQYPSTRKLAERLGTSHSAIAQRLRKYGIGA